MMPEATAYTTAAVRKRSSRFVRRFLRVAAVLVCVVALATASSLIFNAATATPPPAPSGLQFVQAGDVKTRYLRWGERGQPIVLIPGAFETADAYNELGELLGATHRVYAFDLTGIGYSAVVPPLTVDHYARQTAGLIQAFGLTGLDRPILVGHSAGAAVAGLVAVEDPASVAGVVFLDGDALPLAGPSWLPHLVIDPFRTSMLRLGLDFDAAIQAVYGAQCGPGCQPLDAAGLDQWRRPLQQPGTQATVAEISRTGAIAAMTTEDLATLQRTEVPKLVIWGDQDVQHQDQTATDTAQRTAAMIGAPDPVMVAGHHLAMISNPRAVGQAILTMPTR